MNKVQQKTYINVAFALAVIATIFYVSNIYLVQEEEAISSQIVKKKLEINRLAKQNGQVAEINKEYKEIGDKMSKISSLIINDSQKVDFMIELENIAEKYEIELRKDISDKEKEPIGGGLSYAYYKMEATGGFSDLMKFLNDLENLKYYSEIENIKIFSEKKTKDVESKRVVLYADLKLYVNNDKGGK